MGTASPPGEEQEGQEAQLSTTSALRHSRRPTARPLPVRPLARGV